MDGVQDKIVDQQQQQQQHTRGDKGSWSRDGETMESEWDLKMGPFRWDLQICTAVLC